MQVWKATYRFSQMSDFFCLTGLVLTLALCKCKPGLLGRLFMLQLTSMVIIGHVLQGTGCTPSNYFGKDIFCETNGMLQQVHTRLQSVLHADTTDHVGLFHHNLHQGTQSRLRPYDTLVSAMYSRVWVQSGLLIFCKQMSSFMKLAH